MQQYNSCFFVFLFVVEKETQGCYHQMKIMSSAVQAERDVLNRSLTFIWRTYRTTWKAKYTWKHCQPRRQYLSALIRAVLLYCSTFSWWFSSAKPHLWKCIWQMHQWLLDVHWYSILPYSWGCWHQTNQINQVVQCSFLETDWT